MKYPLLFDPRDPYAHYEKAGKLYRRSQKTVAAAAGLPIAALILGTVCVIRHPANMAAHFLFATAALILSLLGSRSYNSMLNFIAAMLSAASAVTVITAGGYISYAGCAMHALAAIVEFASVSSINELIKLKELPGFPLFDPAKENLSFLAKDSLGATALIKMKNDAEEKTEPHRVANTNRTEAYLKDKNEEYKKEKVKREAMTDPTVLRDEIPEEKKLPAAASEQDGFSDLDLFE